MSQQGPELRIGDAEREAAVTALGEHFAAGRLTKDEFDERSERAWAARTASQLWPLFADLPRQQRPGPAPAGPPPTRATQQAPGYGGGWWWRAAVLPLVLVVGALVVLTHLPVFLLVIAVIVLVKVVRPRGWHRHWHAHGYARHSGWESYHR